MEKELKILTQIFADYTRMVADVFICGICVQSAVSALSKKEFS